MTIVVDGERSRKRLPVAKKALANITDMDLPAKAGLLEGFFYKVWQMDGGNLSGGRVVAPFGIFVLLSDETGLKQFVCDSVECAAGPIAPLDRYLLGAATMPAPGATWLASGGPDDADAMILASPLVDIEVDPALQWKAAQPVSLPFGGELVQINACYQRTTPHVVNATQVTHCYSTGMNDEALPAISFLWNFTSDPSADPEAVLNSARRVPLLATGGYFEYAQWKTGALFYNQSGTYPLVMSYEYYYAAAHAYGGLYPTADALFAAATGNLLSKISGASRGIAVRQHGAFYSRVPGDIKGVCLLSLRAENCPSYADPTTPCIHPADADWWITLGFISLAGSQQAVNLGVLGPQIYGLAAGELAWVQALYPTVPFNPADPNGSDASRILATGVAERLFGWPSESEYSNSPRDTVTFADGDGVVYSWLRCTDPSAVQNAEGASYGGTRNGGFKFTPAGGIGRAPLAMPAAVLGDGTLRPRLLLMTATTFYCLADRSGGEIAHLYVGSPFGSWEEVALPASVTMYALRAVLPGDTAAAAGFIGVGKDAATGKYHVYLKLGAQWATLAPIPVATVNDLIASWDVCVFGDDALVMASQQVRQHPVAVQARRPSLR